MNSTGSPPPSWPSAGGDAGAIIRALDWGATRLGPISDWSNQFKSFVDVLLPSKAQIVIFWGADFHAFYNDAFAPNVGSRHPKTYGATAATHWAQFWPELLPVLTEVSETGMSVSLTDQAFVIQHVDASRTAYFDISYSPIRDEHSSAAGVLCIVAETTQRVATARALSETESRLREERSSAHDAAEQLRLAQTAGGVGVFSIDVASNEMLVSAEFCRIFGLPQTARIGATEVEARMLPDAAVFPSTAASRRLGTADLHCEYRIRRPDGQIRWISRRAEYVRNPAGEVISMRGVAHDITDAKTAEATLRESEARFRTLAQAIPNQVWTAAADGELDWFNEKTFDYSGFSEAELIGSGWARIVHPNDRSTAIEIWNRSLATGVNYETEFRVRRRDGAFRWHLIRALPVRTEGGVIRWIGTNTDIEDQKTTQSELERINASLEDEVAARTQSLAETAERLRQSQKMEALGQLTGGIAHDFNNLLTGVIGSLDIMRNRLANGRTQDLDRFMDSASSSAQRAAALTHRLLAFARRQSLDNKPLDLVGLVASMGELLRQSLGEQVDLEVHAPVSVWPVMSDQSQVESAILNLAINARDAMPDGGKLTIELSDITFGESASDDRLDAIAPGDYVVIGVTDTGCGMTPSIMAKAFEPFFTTKPIGQGTGLGLSMIYGFAQQSGGHARIYSEVGRGTTINLYLPRHRPVAADLESASREPESGVATPRGAGETVLLVEDDPAVRLLVVEVLHELGYLAVEATDGNEALPILHSARRIDLMISDVGLPGLNGRQLAEIARQRRPELKILFITGYAAHAAVRSGFLAPGMEMITKPFAMDALAVKIREILAIPKQ
jgi:PAS domain S-box-containing protein